MDRDNKGLKDCEFKTPNGLIVCIGHFDGDNTNPPDCNKCFINKRKFSKNMSICKY